MVMVGVVVIQQPWRWDSKQSRWVEQLGGLLFMPESNYSVGKTANSKATIAVGRKATIYGSVIAQMEGNGTVEGLRDSRTAVMTACDKGSRNVILQVTCFWENLVCWKSEVDGFSRESFSKIPKQNQR